MRYPCPRCVRALELETAPGGAPVERHACRACGGVWLERGALERLAEERRVRLGAQPGAEAGPEIVQPFTRKCPRCRAAMAAELACEVAPVDVCHEHGVWLDREDLAPRLGELQRLAAAAAQPSWWEWPLALDLF
jgi:Zn-finger nucleic acid-binding protein